jgi:hypothetical protein
MIRLWRRLGGAFAAALVTALAVPTAYADAPVPPVGYHHESRPRTGLQTAGAVTFAASYGLAAFSGGFLMLFTNLLPPAGQGVRFADVGFLFVPVAGPFLEMPKAEGDSTVNALLALDGLGQVVGATMLVIGMTWPETVLVRNDLGSVHILPMRMARGGGLGLVGAF